MPIRNGSASASSPWTAWPIRWATPTQLFTMQSISKPFVYATALADRGQPFVSGKVGVEPSGDAFNSISLDPQTGAPLNPMINAGAIATTSLVAGETTEAQWRRIESSIAAFVGRDVRVDESVYRSESETGFRNRAIAWMLKNFGIIDGEPMATLENYFRQCSILVSCRDLAYMAATLANGGVHPLTGQCAPARGARRARAERDGHLRHVRLRGQLAVRDRHAGQERRQRRHHRRRAGALRHRHLLAAARREGQQRARHRRVQASVAGFRPARLHPRGQPRRWPWVGSTPVPRPRPGASPRRKYAPI